jgi:NADPH-dependent 2,4-dienoyl-CoA reductase/sulfur reductase-like enzyme
VSTIVIVGAGPAGIAAAEVLAAHGQPPILIDEGAEPGGQIFRRPRPGLGLDIAALLGAEGKNFRRLHATFAGLRPRIDYRPRTLVWAIHDGAVHTVRDGVAETLCFDALILVTGAVDRVAPLAGWTLPGVFTLGGAQVLLKEHGCLIGRRIVFCGSSPLIYLAADQVRRMGGEIAAVLDTTPFGEKIAAIPQLLAATPTLVRGLRYMVELRRARVPMHHGVRLAAFEGSTGVEAVRFVDASGRERRVSGDAVAFGFGLKPETQLAELAGARLAYDPDFRQWLPATDVDGRCGKNLYAAGDGATIGGAAAAEIGGRLAACALLEDLFGIAPRGIDRAAQRRRLARLKKFQRGAARAFAFPSPALQALADDLMVCRCEGVTAGELRRSAQESFGAGEVNRLRALTRCGMGRCQGRFCSLAAAEITAQALGVPLEAVGRLRAQAPIKPLAMSVRPGTDL